jgi:hypothetical protein
LIDSKGHVFACFAAAVVEKWEVEKEKRQQAPLLPMELSMRSIIAGDRGKSRKTFAKTKAVPMLFPCRTGGTT